jgi:hypothetical protein
MRQFTVELSLQINRITRPTPLGIHRFFRYICISLAGNTMVKNKGADQSPVLVQTG